MVAEHPAPRPDAALLRRWLTAIGLLHAAEEVARRGDDASCSTALIAADSACETLLAILGAWSPKPLPREPRFEDLVTRAVDAAATAGHPIPAALLSDLRASHARRNTVVHHGGTATPADAALGADCARRALELLPVVGSGFGVLPPGGGAAAAIASLLDAPDLADHLLAGEAAVAADDPATAADEAARAFTAIVLRLEPPMRTDRRHAGAFDLRDLGNARRAVDEIYKSVDAIEGWVLALALGMAPASYGRLRRVIGTHVRYMAGNDAIYRGAPPSVAEARWALGVVAETAFRMWQLGGLIEGTQEDVFAARYQTLTGGASAPPKPAE